MITHVEVSNYRSIGERARLELGKLTVLVGPNGSGKSNVADALRFISEALRNGLEAAVTKRHGFPAIRRWSAGRPYEMTLQISMNGEGDEIGTYEIVLGSSRSSEEFRVKREYASYYHPLANPVRLDEFPACFEIVEGEWKVGPKDVRPKVDKRALVLPLIAADERFSPLADALRNLSIYSIFPETLREPQKPDPVRPMTEHGGNWCSVLKHLKDEAWSADLKTALGQITGDIDDIRVRQLGGYLVTEFRHGTVTNARGTSKRPRWFEAAQESDGTLRMAGILTALLQEPPLNLIGIEEPELTIHPGAIPLLYDYMVEASNRSQVLLTTHSPDLLSLLNAEDIRVVERREGITTIAPMEDFQRDAVKERLLNLGELMRMEGLRQGQAFLPSAVED